MIRKSQVRFLGEGDTAMYALLPDKAKSLKYKGLGRMARSLGLSNEE